MPDCEDVVECSVCKGDVIAPIQHTYVMPGVHVEGDCTKAGYTVYTCVRCDHTMEEMDEVVQNLKEIVEKLTCVIKRQ